MGGPQVAKYGQWTSPIKPEDFSADGAVMLSDVETCVANRKVYVLETRGDGRGVIVEFSNGEKRDVLPAQYNSLAQVHEYGGASFAVSEASGHLVFTDMDTKGVFGLDPTTGETIPIIEANKDVYYADFAVHPKEPHLTVAIEERHDVASIADVKNSLVLIDSSSRKVSTLASGDDFYTYPRFSPDGGKIAWISFRFPNMPWDNTQLWLADFQNGAISNTRCIAGQKEETSITQPRWSPDGNLYWVSDVTNYWQLYRLRSGAVEHVKLSGLEEAEFCVPDWFLGGSSYAFLTAETMVACYNFPDRQTVIRVLVNELTWQDLSCPISEMTITGNALKPVSETEFVIIGATPHRPMLAALINIDEGGLGTVLTASSPVELDKDHCSLPKSITYPRKYGKVGAEGEEAHGFFYPPKNKDFVAPEGTLPPLIVAVHGGPTGQEGTGFSLRDMALTTRGYALLQVNYVGSSGYGRLYRQRLAGEWGVNDTGDCVSAVEYLSGLGWIDKNRVGLTGHSAGGFLTMQAMATYPDVWTCGVAESGISDMRLLVAETHKFESRYLEPLCFSGDLADEQKEVVLKDRSPITHAAKIKAPMLIINGEDDPIVPPNQARRLAEIISAHGTATDVVVYPGQGHIFTRGDVLQDIEERRYAWFEKYLAGA